ncbi:DUF5318 family protein [Nonomuraea lactucae]|uniref:DUF5318 family protein n=1 Tax=Nonomuraea lactucae TaxID=2249762 RepID=UPI0013B46931|nr:DUF5318 family protein [Nonomuraea lactucae]
MCSQRKVVDDALATRAVVRSSRARRAPHLNICAAQPCLLRVARRSGAPSGRLCPVYGRENFTGATYVHGDLRARHAGRAKVASDLVRMAHDYDEFRVSLVGVCQGSPWHHLTVSFVLGNGPPDLAGRPSRPKAAGCLTPNRRSIRRRCEDV